MGRKMNVADGYPLNLYCPCIGCLNYKRYKEPNGCAIYPGYRKIPKEIWKGNLDSCPHRTVKEDE